MAESPGATPAQSTSAAAKTQVPTTARPATVGRVVRAPAAAPAGPASPRRMTLDSITVGQDAGPLRLLVYGVEGIGKSSLAAAAPSPVFLGPEDGLENLRHVKRFPEPHTWQDVLDAVDVLLGTDTGLKTLALDTVDWLEPLLWKQVCEQGDDKGIKKANIEDFGFGKGYVKALDGWRFLLSKLERLRKVRGMHVILLAHCHVKTWKNPEGDDFDRYMLKIHEKAAGLLKEWAACVLFANYETFASKDERTKQYKGVATGDRYLYTERAAAYDAKNRFNLPPRVKLDWDELESAIRAGELPAPATLRERIAATLAALADAADESVRARVKTAVAAAGEDALRLTRIHDHLNQMLAAAQAAAAEGAESAQGE